MPLQGSKYTKIVLKPILDPESRLGRLQHYRDPLAKFEGPHHAREKRNEKEGRKRDREEEWKAAMGNGKITCAPLSEFPGSAPAHSFITDCP